MNRWMHGRLPLRDEFPNGWRSSQIALEFNARIVVPSERPSLLARIRSIVPRLVKRN